MSVNNYVYLLAQMQGYAQQITNAQPLPERAAQTADPQQTLPASLQAVLAAKGVERLYSHQAAALDAARQGEHIGIVTATASGKTLCYQLPTLETLLQEHQGRAIYLFPTKALAQDQLRALHQLADPLEIAVATLDGDTPRPERDRLRHQAQIILSNPDMLHRTVLPDHRRWAALLSNLRYVVLDEAHIYRGVFGTHVALVLRRLRRLCAYYGSSPQFICCSATSANPQEHLAALVGDEVRVIDGDGAPQGERTFVFWNPPLREEMRRSNRRGESSQRSSLDQGRRSTNVETANLLAHLVANKVKTLCFTRTRRGAELVLRYTREALKLQRPGMEERVASYRAGYTIDERRHLEQAFLNNELLGLVSTNALELGVDIGGIDAVVIAGFPGSVASTWQQAGRAGRSKQSSLALMVAQDDPLDQFYMRHPEQFFTRSHEHARVALQNPFMLADQLRCAAWELPLDDADELWFGPTYIQLRDWLARRGELRPYDNGQFDSAKTWPAAEVNIRSADGASINLKDSESGRVIEQIGASRAAFEVHPGAIYLHQGDSYLVQSLNGHEALAQKSYVGYYTQPIEETDISIYKRQMQRSIGSIQLHLGVVDVTRTITGYRRKEHYTNAVLSEHDLSLPPQSFRTVAVWWTVPDSICSQIEELCDDALDGLHALEHACIGLLPLFAQCDRADIGGLSMGMHPETGSATIFVYDGVPGGVGIAQIGYEQAEQWWEQALTLLKDCPCDEGCPACVQSPKCGNGNQHLSKQGALALVSLSLGHALPSKKSRNGSSLVNNEKLAQVSAAAQTGLLRDLSRRLNQARTLPPGPRRSALLVALRYRLSVERNNLYDEAGRAELEAIERAAANL
jgi:DEAD/DEAH box helicase domain-containing protein